MNDKEIEACLSGAVKLWCEKSDFTMHRARYSGEFCLVQIVDCDYDGSASEMIDGLKAIVSALIPENVPLRIDILKYEIATSKQW